MTKKQFKDACDVCGKMEVLKGVNGQCLCPECLKKLEEEQNNGNQS